MRLGDGSGSFADGVLVDTGLRETRVAAAGDLNGDGVLDLALFSNGEGRMLLGAGDGTFEASSPLLELPSFSRTGRARIVDLDADGNLDILCVSSQRRVTWLEGDGTGSLLPRTLDAAGATVQGEAYSADVDGDGDLDVLVASLVNTVLLLEQVSPGVFAASVPVVGAQSALREIRLTDFDRDGVVDLALFSRTPLGTVVSLWSSMGNGDGTFQNPNVLLDGLEGVEQIEQREASNNLVSDDFIWSRRGASRIDGAVPALGAAYDFQSGLALLGRNAERFAIGSLRRSFFGSDLVVQEGNGSAGGASLAVFQAVSPLFINPTVVASDLSTLTSIGIFDLDGDSAGDILVSSETAPRLSWIRNRREDRITTRYCNPAVPNITGQPASIAVFGGVEIFNGDFILQANDLPASTTTLFLTSQNPGFQPVVPGSIGTLCLGGSIGRFVGPGQLQTSSADGAARLSAPRNMIPQPGGFVTAFSGSVWYFQAWYRDTQAGVSVSNFTDAQAVVF